MTTGPLAEHCIARIETERVQSRYPRLVGKNARLGIHGEGPTSRVCVLTTDTCAVGWGLCGASDETLAPFVGRSVADLFDPAVGVTAPEALPLDFALHDLAGVILGLPVWKMLGARGVQENIPAVPCYDGAIYMDDILPEDAPRGVEVVLENCRADYALGYRAFKLKIGRGHKWMEAEAGLARDIEVTRRVRETFPECGILVDANDGYTLDSFLRYLAAVTDCGLFWIEEPFRENRDDLSGLRAFLNEHSPDTRIADGESAPDLDMLLPLARESLLNVLIMDIAGFGFTPWRRLMPELKAAGILASPHTWGEPLKTFYTAQLAAGLGNVLTVEGIPSTSEDIDTSAYWLEEGMLYLPTNVPGFGLRLLRNLPAF